MLTAVIYFLDSMKSISFFEANLSKEGVTMSKKTLFAIIASAVLILLASNGYTKETPAETVIAEFDGGQITYGDIEYRISKISPMYQQKYKTYDGKVKLLEMMCTEELFYQEALTRNIQADPKFAERTDLQIKSQFYKVYKKELLASIVLTEDEIQAYYNEHQDEFPGKTLKEVKSGVENKLRQTKETELLDATSQQLLSEYGFAIDEEVLNSVKLDTLDNNTAIENALLVTANDPSQSRSVKYFINVLKQMSPAQAKRMADPKNFRDYITFYMEASAYTAKARELGYASRPELVEAIDQINKTMMLRTVYNSMVVDKLDYSDDAVRAYYDDNIAQFSSRNYRTIQAFTFDDEETAKRILKKYRKALGYGFMGIKSGKIDQEALDMLIKDYSAAPKNNGILDYVYKNDIIPGLGNDKIYSAKVWESKVNEISKVFADVKGKYVFFRVTEDHPAEPEAFDFNKVKQAMTKDLSKKLFDEANAALAEKYHLKKYEDRLEERLTAKEYFTKAEEAQKSRRFKDAVFYYDQIIKYYPNGTDDYKAAFMKAFLHSEEMDQKEEALKLFKEFVKAYPKGELLESAQFMIDELEGKKDLMESFDK